MKKSTKKIYLIGIKGVGMTMLAQFLTAQGHQVSGSDVEDSFLTDQVLRRAKIKVFTPFKIKNIPINSDLIIYTSACGQTNLELNYILQNRQKFVQSRVISYAQALGELFNQYQGLAVCGSHGKTTVSAWLGYLLWKAGHSPNVLVGSRVPQFYGSSLLGKSRLFIAEVDEYQNKFQYFQPHQMVLTNIDYDHPDFFPDRIAYRRTFINFVKKIPSSGFLILNHDDPESWKIEKYNSGKTISYGFKKTADYQAINLNLQKGGQTFEAIYHGRRLGKSRIKLIGEHNVSNALAVIAAARQLKVPNRLIQRYLASFSGTDRRSQILGHYQGALIVDDYAHHPTEIQATLRALSSNYPQRKIITVFHPHTFSRTQALLSKFITSFSQTNELIILDIYGSAREKQGGISSQQLVKKIIAYNKQRRVEQSVIHIANLQQATNYLQKKLTSHDLLLLMGAGDVFRIGQKLLQK